MNYAGALFVGFMVAWCIRVLWVEHRREKRAQDAGTVTAMATSGGVHFRLIEHPSGAVMLVVTPADRMAEKLGNEAQEWLESTT